MSEQSILANNSRLNLAFLANLFNNYPGLQKPAEHEDLYKETREEKNTPPVFDLCLLPSWGLLLSLASNLSAAPAV